MFFDALGVLALGQIPVSDEVIVIGIFHARAPRVVAILDDDDDLLLAAWFALMQPQNIKIKTGE